MRFFAAARNVNVAFSVRLAKKVRDQIAVERHAFSADGAHPRQSCFERRIAMRTAVDDAVLLGRVHRAIHARNDVFALFERGLTQRTMHDESLCLGFDSPFFLRGFLARNSCFPRKKSRQTPNYQDNSNKQSHIRNDIRHILIIEKRKRCNHCAEKAHCKNARFMVMIAV